MMPFAWIRVAFVSSAPLKVQWGARLFAAILCVAAAGLALAGCQTLNQEQCSVTDWRTLGGTDGAAGRPQDHVARHQEACGKFAIPVDVADWRSGWEEGIRHFCTPLNGLEVGIRGSHYANSCPADLAVPFRAAYDVGYDVHAARSERDRIGFELEDAIDGLAAAKEEERTMRRLQIEFKRSQLFTAERRLREAERAAGLYRLRLAAAR